MTSREEEEYFARQEYEKRKVLAEKARAEMQEAEKKQLKELHWMHCPKCGTELITLQLHAVEIDKCPTCNGIWLDDGEIEQIVERDDRSVLRKVVNIFR